MTKATDLAERLNWLHCCMQELENDGVGLPMGDYTDVYGILEDAREILLMEEPYACERCGDVYNEARGDGYCGLCPSCADATEPKEVT